MVMTMIPMIKLASESIYLAGQGYALSTPLIKEDMQWMNDPMRAQTM